MKRLILSVLVVFAIAVVVVGCGSSNTSGNTELQGTWAATSPDNTSTITFTFSGHDWTMAITSIETSASDQESGTFTIDSAANPKTIDVHFVNSNYPSDPNVGTTALGIYQLSGTNLTLGLGDPGNATRPTSFTEDTNTGLLYLVKQ